MKVFKHVMWDIVGTCTGKCPYCVTGARRERPGGPIPVDLFHEIAERLTACGAIDLDTVVQLYCWGEPLLHPDLAGIIGKLNALGVRFALSTSASKAVPLATDDVRNLEYLTISMPGFSQNSYDRIHGFRFDEVKKNTTLLIRHLQDADSSADINLVFHVYQFNLDEIPAARRFAAEHGMKFKPCYAIMNDWDLLHSWLEGSLPYEKMRQISEDLFCHEIRRKMREAPSGYACPQLDYLVVDEAGNVGLCCQTPWHDEKYRCGNLQTDDFGEVLDRKRSHTVCRDCLDSGLAYYLNNSLGTPDFCRLPESEACGLLSRRWLSRLRGMLTRRGGRKGH